MKATPHSPTQLTLDSLFDPSGHGGRRANAGRRRGRQSVAHRERTEFPSRYPLHITLDIVDGVYLRRWNLLATFLMVVASTNDAAFRIVEYNVESNHVHMICEARDPDSLSRGIQGFKSSLARLLNRQLGRSGALFEERYHARPLASPTEVRNALRYVLNNARHHAAERGQRIEAGWFDPFSSAAWFDGWCAPLEPTTREQRVILAAAAPTARPATWLLAVGWKRLGLLAIDEVPGSRRSLRRFHAAVEEEVEQRRLVELMRYVA